METECYKKEKQITQQLLARNGVVSCRTYMYDPPTYVCGLFLCCHMADAIWISYCTPHGVNIML